MQKKRKQGDEEQNPLPILSFLPWGSLYGLLAFLPSDGGKKGQEAYCTIRETHILYLLFPNVRYAAGIYRVCVCFACCGTQVKTRVRVALGVFDLSKWILWLHIGKYSFG